LNESSSTSDYVTKVKAAGFVVERVNSSTLNRGKENTTIQERLRSAFLPLGSEALDTNYTVRSFQVTLSKNGSHGIIEGDLIRDGGYGAGATGIKKLGKAIVEFPTTITLLIRLAHFLQKEIRDAEREESIEKMSIVDSATTQLAVHVEIMFYELGD
jgi:S-adenosylmethionine synthetase